MAFRNVPIDELELSVRATNALKAAGFTDAQGVLDYFTATHKAAVLRRMPNFGAKSYREVREALSFQILSDPPMTSGPGWFMFSHGAVVEAVAPLAYDIADRMLAQRLK